MKRFCGKKRNEPKLNSAREAANLLDDLAVDRLSGSDKTACLFANQIIAHECRLAKCIIASGLSSQVSCRFLMISNEIISTADDLLVTWFFFFCFHFYLFFFSFFIHFLGIHGPFSKLALSNRERKKDWCDLHQLHQSRMMMHDNAFLLLTGQKKFFALWMAMRMQRGPKRKWPSAGILFFHLYLFLI